MNCPLRIMVGVRDICGMLLDYADGFRRLGHQVTTAVVEPARFYEDLEFDVNLTPNAPDIIPWPKAIAGTQSPLVRYARGAMNRVARLSRIMNLVRTHDVFLFQYGGQSLFGQNREYPLLKRLGKRIVCLFVGNDIRHISSYRQQFPEFAESTVQPLEVVMRSKGDGPLEQPLRNLRMAERYGDLLLSGPGMAGLQVRPYMHFQLPAVLSRYEFRVPGREVPVVLHAPSRKAYKGTTVILAELDRLRADGVRFDLRLLDGVPNKELLPMLPDADVLVDQLNSSLHGKLGIEAMASGCALATCNREDFDPFPPNRPIWHIDDRCIYNRLKRLFTDRALRIRLANEGRNYVERYHDHVSFARRIVDSLESGSIVGHTHYPAFFARKYRLDPGTTIPTYLKRMTAEIVQCWGLPADVDPNDIIARGLMSADGLDPGKPIPRWTEGAPVSCGGVEKLELVS